MESNILVIYTGGTIGMVQDAETGALAPFYRISIATSILTVSIL
jgi:L-asparaginase/Glu-tRNA(Gln) amidotransferase subunit D